MKVGRVDTDENLHASSHASAATIDPGLVAEKRRVVHQRLCIALDGRIDRDGLAVACQVSVAGDIGDQPEQLRRLVALLVRQPREGRAGHGIGLIKISSLDPPALRQDAVVGREREHATVCELQLEHTSHPTRKGSEVRVDPAGSDRLLASTKARMMEMRGREMPGWLRVDAADVRTKQQLAKWVRIGVAYARSLPAKR